MTTYRLAIDLGASSGRHIVGYEEEGQLKTVEVYRFQNDIRTLDGHYVWDIKRLFYDVKQGIKAAFLQFPKITSLSIDAWGTDYVLLRKDEELPPCYSYRDSCAKCVIDEVHQVVPFEELYERTGIQFQPFNTIYRFFEDMRRRRLDLATDFLMIPEYLNFLLTGRKMHEYTNATTTGLVNADTKGYDSEIVKRLGLPEKLFGELYGPGTVVGELLPQIAEEVGGQTKVVLCASHDTASAVEGIPMDENSPYISSGTWSLLGVKVGSAIKDEKSRMANFSNEGGVGYIRYQKNIMGMWVVNRLREELCPDKRFPQIVDEARESAFDRYVDVNDNSFLAPESMARAFEDALGADHAPQKESDYFRCAYLSLAHSYDQALKELSDHCKERYQKLYIVGGGAKNAFLNELCERICRIQVVALPIEASAIGNLKIQMEGNRYV